MNRMNIQRIAKALLFPHPIIAVVLSVAAGVLLAYGFIACEPTGPVSIASYVMSFYALVVICLRVPGMVRWAQRFRHDNPYYLRYAGDIRLRMSISLDGALVFNAAYAAFQLCLGIRHASAWFYAMAGYYFLLSGMRLMLARHVRCYAPGSQKQMEWRKYRLCGVCLLMMNLALLVFILYFIWQIRIFVHHEITTIAMATYTFASLTMAVISVNRYRKQDSPVYLAAKHISFASATVSVLTLENAMFTAFGQETSELLRRIMLGATGAFVFLFVQGMALYMIAGANRRIKEH